MHGKAYSLTREYTMQNFIQALTAQTTQATAVKASFALTDRIVSVLFDDLTASATGTAGDTQRNWVSRVVDVHLTKPTRRAFTVTARAFINAVGISNASARISVGGQTTIREVRSRDDMREMKAELTLHVRRSPEPRDRLRVMLWVEAKSEEANAQADAVFDSCDVQLK